MNEFDLTVHFNPLWGIIVYVFRALFEFFIGKTNRIDKKNYLKEKLTSIGTDIFWISFVIWGIVLVKSDPQNYFVASFGSDNFGIRILVLITLVVLGIFITFGKSKEMKMRQNPTRQISTLKLDFKLILLNLILLIVGISSFWGCFFYLSSIKIGVI